ncbi:MAG: phosphotransferase family protein [Frankiales bacterium]|nr:phosphotransferase family protein [Frankiales bacterium]
MTDDLRALTEQAAPPAAVGTYLAAELGDDAWRDVSVSLISGGKSNLTFVVTSSAGDVVLRRPPLSTVLPTAHDMRREHRVMTGLWDTPVPVPRTLALCTDESVLGAPFYVMERVAGHIVREQLPDGYAETPDERRAIGEGLIDVLAALHEVDPGAVGLGDYGKPAGYLERQVRRWTMQWEATPEPEDSNDGPELDRLAKRLAETLPGQPTGPIVHGDYRLDNVMLDPAKPGVVAAVLDWELSTLGDPLADLGLLYVYWQEKDDGAVRQDSMAVPSVTALDGFPTRRELFDRYAARTGRDISALPWYVGFGCFKLAVVCAGVAARGRAGAMIGEGFIEMAQRIGPLVRIGHSALDGNLS